MRREVVAGGQRRMLPGETTDDGLPFAHGPILALGDHTQLLAPGSAMPKVVDMLLNALLRLLALELSC